MLVLKPSIMHDSKVLAACIASRGAFSKVAAYVEASEFSPVPAFWWPLVLEWYMTDPEATSIDIEILREKGKRQADPKHLDTFLGLIDSLPEPPSPQNVVTELLEVKRFVKGNELAQAVAGNDTRKKIKRLLSEYDDLLSATEFGKSTIQYAASVDDLNSVMGVENKLSLHPAILNSRTDGGCLPGDFVIVFGRPEMGKTLFCINLCSHWLRKGAKILYVGNEDKVDKIKARIRLNLANMTKDDALKWEAEANKRAKAAGIDDRLVMVHLHPGSVTEIEELVQQHEPTVLVIDQLRNIGGGGDGLTSRLNQVSIDVRQLLSKYELIGLAVTQANAGEHNKPKIWLESGDVDSSRTGIPAQADLLLGIGGNESMINSNTRAISLCKNKLSGDHQGFTVQIDTQRNKIS